MRKGLVCDLTPVEVGEIEAIESLCWELAEIGDNDEEAETTTSG